MTDFRLITAAVICAGIVATTNLATAQDYVPTVEYCVPTTDTPPSWRWWASYHPDFVRNWGPFFRRHVYRYGPIAVCSAPATPAVISSKY
jgi:hypothetical protein